MRAILQIGMGWFGEEPGGLNRMYAGLLAGLADCGVPVRGLVAGDERVAKAPANVTFFARRDAHPLRRLAECRRLAQRALRDERVEVIAAHFAPYALPVLDCVRNASFVFHFHGPWSAESRAERQGGLGVRLKRAIEAAVYRRAHKFIVLSHAFGDVLVETYGVRSGAVEVVPGGVDVARFATGLSRREARQALALPTDRAVVGTVRRLVHRVGLEGLIDAFELVRARVPDALLLIAGTGPLAAQLAAAVRERSLEEHVKFMGFVPDEQLPLLYRACDVSIVPSVALEGFGLTTVESLAAGTPVLVTPVGGLPETVRALDAGLVLPDSRAASIADALAAALTGRRALPDAERCAGYARANFDWRVIARRVLAVYG